MPPSKGWEPICQRFLLSKNDVVVKRKRAEGNPALSQNFCEQCNLVGFRLFLSSVKRNQCTQSRITNRADSRFLISY